jgi:voltage-gated potassium channel Kch
MVRKHFPNLTILARARNRRHAHLLMELGVKTIVRETLFSSLKLAGDLLGELGLDKQDVEHTVEMFQTFDQDLLMRQYAVFQDETKLIQTSKEAAEELEMLLQEDRNAANAVSKISA